MTIDHPVIEQRKQLYAQQTALREVLTTYDRYEEALRLFFRQHAMLHSAAIAEGVFWSFPDAILAGLSTARIRHIPQGEEHSPAWCLWHSARCEDVTMNILVAGREQVLREGDWPARMKIAVIHTGNAMNDAEMAALSAAIDLPALQAYRLAVGRRTREIVASLTVADLKRMVDPGRIQQLRETGAVTEAAWGVAEYWSRRDVAGLLLMPATRHNLIHLNEAWQLLQKRQ